MRWLRLPVTQRRYPVRGRIVTTSRASSDDPVWAPADQSAGALGG